MNIKKNFNQNVFFKYCNFFLIFLSGFFLIPFYLNFFSLELFGSWIVVSAFTSWLLFFDPGSSNLIIQQISRNIGKKSFNKIDSIIISGLINTFILSLLIFFIGINLVDPLLNWAIKSSSKILQIETAFRYSILSISIMLFVSSLIAILEGFQKMIIIGIIVLSSTVIKIISVILFIKLNFGIKALPLSDIISSINSLIICLIVISSNLNLYIKKIQLRLTDYVNYTSLYLYNFTSRFTKILGGGGLDSIFIGKFIGLESVSLFHLTQTLPKKFESFLSIISLAGRPALGYLSGKLDKKNFAYIKLKLIYFILIAFTFMIFLFYDTIDPFVKLWINKDITIGSNIILLIVIFVSLRLLTNTLNLIIFSTGKIKQISKIQMLYALFLLPSLFIGINFFDIEGLLTAHIIVLFFILTIYLSILIFKNLYLIKNYKKKLISELFYLMMTFFISSMISLFIFKFFNFEPYNWIKLFLFIIIKITLFMSILFTLSKEFRSEIIYLYKKRKIKPLNKFVI